MVACCMAGLSPACSFCRRFSSGCISCIAFMERGCFRVRGKRGTPTALGTREEGTPAPGGRAVLANCLVGILGAGREIAAPGAEQRGHQPSVPQQQLLQPPPRTRPLRGRQLLHVSLTCSSTAWTTQATTCGNGASSTALPATTTESPPTR